MTREQLVGKGPVVVVLQLRDGRQRLGCYAGPDDLREQMDVLIGPSYTVVLEQLSSQAPIGARRVTFFLRRCEPGFAAYLEAR